MAGGARWRNISLGAKAFISLVTLLGAGVLVYGAADSSSRNIAEFICYLLIILLASRFKVNMPEVADTMSANFLFVLIAVIDLSFTETLILGSVGVLLQCFYSERPRPIRVTYSLCASACAIGLTYYAYHNVTPFYGRLDIRPLVLVLAACVYFLANTALMGAIAAFGQAKSFKRTWLEGYAWSFTYYVVGAAIAGLIAWINRSFQWQTSLLVLPIIYLIYRSYRLYLGK